MSKSILPPLLSDFSELALLATGTWREHLNVPERLTLFYKFVNNLSPSTLDLIPTFHLLQVIKTGQKFKSSFYPNCLSEWNKLEPEFRLLLLS